MPLIGTPKEMVRFSYANVFEPREDPSGNLKYSVSIMIPKTHKNILRKIHQLIDGAIKAGIDKGKITKADSKKASFKLPIRDGDQEFKDGDRGPEYKGVFFINMNTSDAPGVVDRNWKPLSSDEFYSGCHGIVHANSYVYNTNGNKGVTFGLNHVMKGADDDRLDGRVQVSDAFEGVEWEDEEEAGDLA